jgi:hypothetical protein
MNTSERYHISNFKEEPYLVMMSTYQNRFGLVKRFQTISAAEKYAKARAAKSRNKETYFIMEARVAYSLAPTTNPVIEHDFLTGEDTTITLEGVAQ